MRLFVVERLGRIRLVEKDGKVQDEPFIDLTKINPLGNDVQTGFVEQGLWSIAFHPKFKQNGYVYLHYSSLPFNGASVIVRVTVDPKSPNVVTAEQINKTANTLMNMPQPYYNHNGGGMQFGPDGYLLSARVTAGGKAIRLMRASGSTPPWVSCCASTSMFPTGGSEVAR